MADNNITLDLTEADLHETNFTGKGFGIGQIFFNLQGINRIASVTIERMILQPERPSGDQITQAIIEDINAQKSRIVPAILESEQRLYKGLNPPEGGLTKIVKQRMGIKEQDPLPKEITLSDNFLEAIRKRIEAYAARLDQIIEIRETSEMTSILQFIQGMHALMATEDKEGLYEKAKNALGNNNLRFDISSTTPLVTFVRHLALGLRDLITTIFLANDYLHFLKTKQKEHQNPEIDEIIEMLIAEFTEEFLNKSIMGPTILPYRENEGKEYERKKTNIKPPLAIKLVSQPKFYQELKDYIKLMKLFIATIDETVEGNNLGERGSFEDEAQNITNYFYYDNIILKAAKKIEEKKQQ